MPVVADAWNPQNLQEMGLAFNNARDKLYVVVPDPVDSDGDGYALEHVVLGIPVINSGSASNQGRLDEDPASWDVIEVGRNPTDVAYTTVLGVDYLLVSSLGSAYPPAQPAQLEVFADMGNGTFSSSSSTSLEFSNGFQPLSVATRESSADNSSARAILAGHDATGPGSFYSIQAFLDPILLPESPYRTSGLARRVTVMGQ